MNNPGDDDTPPDEPTPDRTRQLFGTKGGAKPWGDPPAEREPAPSQAATSSAPYPRDATYTPRPAAVGEQVDDEGELTLLHPNYKLLMRISAIVSALVLLAAAAVAEEVLRTEIGLPLGVILVPALIVAGYLAIPWPARRYRARGYQISADRLRVVRGILFHSDTIVPFGRVQHIDVDQGPIERALGIATLTLHTAGSHNASVHLPGLGHELAVEMREQIRAHIKRESM
jgi:hypothetical protein